MIRLPHPRFLSFVAILAVLTAVGAASFGVATALIVGFDLAALVFLATSLPLWLQDHADRARARSLRDDGGRVLLLLTMVAVLGATLVALWQVAEPQGARTLWQVAANLGTLMLVWLFANTVLAFHYAHLYYDQHNGRDAGGILFPGTDAPVFADFVYFSFIIGMTAQTADLTITARRLRRVATLHGLCAFAFNLLVLAFCINILSGRL